MKTSVLALTTEGKKLAERIAQGLDHCSVCHPENGIVRKIKQLWKDTDGLICIMAAGIVVRAIAPLCKSKKTDPCVVVLDEKGEFVISLLSGHIGGGNDLARKIAALLGAQPVITTASDVTGHTALDIWIDQNGFIVDRPERITHLSAKLINAGSLGIFTDGPVHGLPEDFPVAEKKHQADLLLSPFIQKRYRGLWLIPRNLVIGIGCNRGTTSAEFESAVDELFQLHEIDQRAVIGLASIDLKQDETGLLEFAEKRGLPITFFSKDALNGVDGVAVSEAALKVTGAKGVAEPAALLAASIGEAVGRLLVGKRKWKNVTAAIAAKEICLKDR